MKTILSFVAVAFFVSNLMGMEDGLYDISDAAHPKLIDSRVGKVAVFSQSNDNREYGFQIQAAGDFSLSEEKIQLVISNQTIPFNQWGMQGGNAPITTNNVLLMEGRKLTSLGGTTTNLEIVPLIAKHFHVTVLDRHHPGYQMLIQFIPAKNKFSTNEPVMATFRITNVGKTNFSFFKLRPADGNSSHLFTFTAYSERGKMLPVAFHPTYLMEDGLPMTLKPGQSHEMSVDLTKSFNFAPGEDYVVTGSYPMSFIDLDVKDFNTIWQDYAYAEFLIRIKK